MTALGWQPAFNCLQRLAARFCRQAAKWAFMRGDEGGKLRVLVDRGFDGRLVHGKVEVAGAIGLEQRLPQLRADVPIAFAGHRHRQRGCRPCRWPSMSCMSSACLAVDVARQVEVELVLLDLLDADHAGIFRDFEPPVEDIDDLVDVLGAEAVLGAVLHEAAHWRRS